MQTAERMRRNSTKGIDQSAQTAKQVGKEIKRDHAALIGCRTRKLAGERRYFVSEEANQID
ncbi:MAG TPA: hypothetical protein PLV19_10970 [Nitrosomonas sp.]|nr:hypothetical protein [Nitrosomonas sp.]HRB33778.1 hypothetical protein [Nitrosomonas sp.]HRB78408.1 hypothetical protein [Nitrosomonas sp.]